DIRPELIILFSISSEKVSVGMCSCDLFVIIPTIITGFLPWFVEEKVLYQEWEANSADISSAVIRESVSFHRPLRSVTAVSDMRCTCGVLQEPAARMIEKQRHLAKLFFMF